MGLYCTMRTLHCEDKMCVLIMIVISNDSEAQQIHRTSTIPALSERHNLVVARRLLDFLLLRYSRKRKKRAKGKMNKLFKAIIQIRLQTRSTTNEKYNGENLVKIGQISRELWLFKVGLKSVTQNMVIYSRPKKEGYGKQINS